jgi:hypothetical protein
MTAQSVQGTRLYTTWVTLAPGELAVVQVKANFPATPTDDLEVYILQTLDDTSETSDNQTSLATVLINTDDPAYKSFPVSGMRKFRVGVIRTGSTDTITVDIWVRKDGVDLGA